MEEKPTGVEKTQDTSEVGMSQKISFHKFKILVGILGFLVLGGAVFGAYKLGQKQARFTIEPTPTPAVVTTPTPDPTADWITYRSKNFNFEIKHPSQFSPTESIAPSGPIRGAASFYLKDGDRCSQDDISFYINFNNEGGVVSQQKLISSEPIKVSSIQTDLIVRELPSNDHCIVIGKSKMGDFFNAYVYFESDGDEWSIMGRIRTDYLDSDLHLFRQILSTFRVLSSAGSNQDVKEWKTYTDNAYRYSFKYPPEFLITDYSVVDMRQVKFSKENYEVMMRVRKAKETLYYQDQEAVEETRLGGRTARLYKFPKGFCEIECTSPLVAVVTYKGDYRYVMEFYQTTEISGVYQQILSTFRFLE